MRTNILKTATRQYCTIVKNGMWSAYYQPLNPKNGQPWQRSHLIERGHDCYRFACYESKALSPITIGQIPPMAEWKKRTGFSAPHGWSGFSTEELALAAISAEIARQAPAAKAAGPMTPEQAIKAFEAEIVALNKTNLGGSDTLTFGYLGNVWNESGMPRDDRSWYIFGLKSGKFGGVDTKDLPKMWTAWQTKKQQLAHWATPAPVKLPPAPVAAAPAKCNPAEDLTEKSIYFELSSKGPLEIIEETLRQPYSVRPGDCNTHLVYSVRVEGRERYRGTLAEAFAFLAGVKAVLSRSI